jgi:hypothetical protein
MNPDREGSEDGYRFLEVSFKLSPVPSLRDSNPQQVSDFLKGLNLPKSEIEEPQDEPQKERRNDFEGQDDRGGEKGREGEDRKKELNRENV